MTHYKKKSLFIVNVYVRWRIIGKEIKEGWEGEDVGHKSYEVSPAVSNAAFRLVPS